MRKAVLTRLAAVAAGGALALAAAAPALAAETEISLHASHRGATADAFVTQRCDGDFSGLAANLEGWHFLVTQVQGAFLGLVLNFEDATGSPVVVERVDPADFTFSGAVVHLPLVRPKGWTLIDGYARVDGSAGGLQLSHTCPGPREGGLSASASSAPAPDPSARPGAPYQDTAPPVAAPAFPPSGTPRAPGKGGGLPVTGSTALGGTLILGMGLLAAGIAMMSVRRRRDLHDLI